MEDAPALPRLKAVELGGKNQVRHRVLTQNDVPLFQQSAAHALLNVFLLRLSAAARGPSTSQPPPARHAITAKVVEFLEEVKRTALATELETRAQRFGNRAFRTWHSSALMPSFDAFLSTLYGTNENLRSTLEPELRAHLDASFGSPVRIDYGTGHELSFLAFLLLLHLSLPDEVDERETVLVIWPKYWEVTRAIQTWFRLEPAGSRGVWGLDDYAFLPYLLGSSQFLDQSEHEPSMLLASAETLAPLHDRYPLLLGALLHTHALKTTPSAPLHLHSPLLHTVGSTVPNWTKVHQGFIKMYRDEVLGKWTVIQHFAFGDVGLRFVDEGGNELSDRSKEYRSVAAASDPTEALASTTPPLTQALGPKTTVSFSSSRPVRSSGPPPPTTIPPRGFLPPPLFPSSSRTS